LGGGVRELGHYGKGTGDHEHDGKNLAQHKTCTPCSITIS
jgi:hypothetical protein